MTHLKFFLPALVLILIIAACKKTTSVTVYPLTGTWAFRAQAGTKQVGQSLAATEAFSSSITDASVEVSFGDNGQFGFITGGVQSFGTYTQTQSDTVLTITPDSAAFANLCFPNPTITFITTPPGQGIPVSPVPPALYHTPGKAIITVLTADSLNIKADWIISGTSGAPDTTMHAETGFRRTSN